MKGEVNLCKGHIFPKTRARSFSTKGTHLFRNFLWLSRCSGSIDTWQSFACALGPGAKCREGWAEGGVTWFQSEISEIWPCFDESDLLLVVLIQYCGPLFLLNSHVCGITLILAEQIWKLYLYTSHSRRRNGPKFSWGTVSSDDLAVCAGLAQGS